MPTADDPASRGLGLLGRPALVWMIDMKDRISGKEATYAAMEAAKRGPIRVEPSPEDNQRAIGSQGALSPSVPAVSDDLDNDKRPKAPPRVLKPSPRHDRCLAPTPDLEGHRKCLREAFGNTLSDEFADVIMGKLVEALRPSPFDQLEESTLNAGLALIHSMKPRSELEALLAVQIVATGFSGLRFLRQSHRHMTEDFIDVYGGYAIKLLRLQADLICAFDRHRHGSRQMVEVRHVHMHSGSQGVIGIINNGQDGGGGNQRK
jgi:hypothetical protein